LLLLSGSPSLPSLFPLWYCLVFFEYHIFFVNISITFTPVAAAAAILVEGGSAIIAAGYGYYFSFFSSPTL
jgi:hypothetical protein